MNIEGLACQAKIANFSCAILRDQNVGWLNVPVDHPSTVDVVDPAQDVIQEHLELKLTNVRA